jgi:hypothetical protein
MAGSRFVVPPRRRPLYDYRRPCDRCAWEGWLRSQLTREEQTGLLVCQPCLDEPQEDRDPLRAPLVERIKIID